MSDTASLELCKELYELSGWKTESMGLHQNRPSYDAGYLLRKLPRYELTNNSLIVSANHYDGNNDRFISAYGDPDKLEDILAELCIKMFKTGILPISGRD